MPCFCMNIKNLTSYRYKYEASYHTHATRENSHRSTYLFYVALVPVAAVRFVAAAGSTTV